MHGHRSEDGECKSDERDDRIDHRELQRGHTQDNASALQSDHSSRSIRFTSSRIRLGPVAIHRMVRPGPSQCQSIDLGSYTGQAYTYAETSGGTQYWGSGPVNVCVNKSQNFTIADSTNATACAQDITQKMVPTFPVTLVTGTNSFNFNP